MRVLIGNPFALDEEPLDETVQQLRRYLDGQHQVLDLGTIGLFRVYEVQPYPAGNLGIIPSRNLQRVHGTRAHDFLKQIHTAADYKRNASAGPDDQVYVWALSEKPAYRAALANIKQASDAITALGIPRQRDVLILRDLSAERNRITGGGVGGYAFRKTHAVEADVGELARSHEILVHEWAHKKFFNLPRHATQHVRDWFAANVEKAPEVVGERERVAQRDRGHTTSRAWEAFRAAWGKWDGVFPDHYLGLRAKVKGTSGEDKAALFDVFLTPGMIGVGTVKKGIRNPEGGEGIRKGSEVLFLSARAVAPDAYQIIQQSKSEGGENRFIQSTADAIRANIELDVRASADKNKLDAHRLNYLLGQMRLPDDPDEERADNFFTRESFLYSTVDDAVAGAIDYLVGRKIDVDGGDLFSVSARAVFVEEWIERARRDGDKFDPEKTFRELFDKFASWDDMPTSHLSDPSGTTLRDFAAKAGITPSSYAASNVDELWAELIAHMALRPSTVPKPLKQLLRDTLQGKTHDPGPKASTPRKYRQVAGEATVILGYNPFLDEAMNRHGNKRSHASRVRAYKKSGKMVAQTFSTGSALGRSNEADKYIAYYRAGLEAYSDNAPMTSNPYEVGTSERGWWGRGWTKGWEQDGFPTTRDMRSSAEKKAGAERAQAQRTREAGRKAARDWQITHSPGWLVRAQGATDLPENPYESGSLRAAWQSGFDGEMRESIGEVAESVVLLDRSPFA